MIPSLSTYSRETLLDTLRILKLYKTSLVQIGHRAHLQDPKSAHETVIRVEYPQGASMDEVSEFTHFTLKKSFAMDTIPKGIQYVEAPDLIGGIRVFVDDDMVDVSFKKFANLLKSPV